MIPSRIHHWIVLCLGKPVRLVLVGVVVEEVLAVQDEMVPANSFYSLDARPDEP